MTRRLLPGLVLLAAGCVDVPEGEVGTTSGEVSVTWTNLVGVTASGNGLTKTAGTSAWDAGAVSVETLTADGYVELAVGETGTNKAAGLSTGDGGQHYSDIDFALRFTASGAVQVHEGGVLRGTFGLYAAGDRFRIEVKGGVVRYSRSGAAPFYTSALAPSFPLLVDTALLTPGATLSDVELVATGLTWQNVVGVAVSGKSLSKSAGTTGWTAGASSVQTLAGDGFLDFAVADNTTAKAAGLSNGDSDQSYTDIDYALRLNANGVVYVWEAGVLRGNFGSYLAGDRFRVEVAGGVVRYSRNGGLPFYISQVAPTFPLLVDTAFSTPGATLNDLALVEAADACPAYDGTGLVCSGSFVVNNSIDLAEIASCANITGNLTISAPGMTEIALPVLERIGGNLTVTGNTDMARLRLPALKEIGGATVLEALAATGGVDLSHLHTAGGLETRVYGSLEMNVPCLDTSGTLDALEWNGGTLVTAPIHVPRLRQVTGSLVRGEIVAPVLTTVGGDISNGGLGTSRATVVAPVLTDVGGTVFFHAGHNVPALQRIGSLILLDAPVIDLPALLEIETDLFGSGDLAATALDLPALQRVGSIVLLWPGLQQLSLPALETITGPDTAGRGLRIQSTGITSSITLPALTLINGDLDTDVRLILPALIEVRGLVYLGRQLSAQQLVSVGGSLNVDGPISAPALAYVGGNLRLLDFQGPVSLPSLASVGGIRCYRGLVTSLDLPALTEVTPATGGAGAIQVQACRMTSISAPLLESIPSNFSVIHNGFLTSLDFASLTSVGPLLEIYRNRELPACYATNLHDQLLAAGWTGIATIHNNNGAGSCP